MKIFKNRRKFYQPVGVTSTIMTKFSWFNTSIMIGNNGLSFSYISNKGINYVGQLFKKIRKLEAGIKC